MSFTMPSYRSIAARAAPATAPTNTQVQEAKNDPVVSRITPREQLILFSIGGREMYGLAIQQVIADASRGQERVTLGTIYPILKSLEEKGLVEGRWEDESPDNRAGARRRYYRLTERGIEAVQQILDFQQRLLNGGEFAQ